MNSSFHFLLNRTTRSLWFYLAGTRKTKFALVLHEEQQKLVRYDRIAILGSHPPGSEQLTADERDRLVERGAARTGVTHRGVLVPDRHAAEEDEPVRG